MPVDCLTVSIIVHEDFSHIDQTLSTLYQNSHLRLEVYVTINKGDKGKVTALKARFPQVHYVVNDTPAGFAHNHNQVLRLAQTELVALLNDDIIVTPSMIDHMIAFMDVTPDVGLASPRVVNPDGSSQLTAFNDPGLFRMIYSISGLGRFTPHGGRVRRLMQRYGASNHLGVASLVDTVETRFVPVVVGVAMFVRRAAYEQAGMMDESTLVYGEESAWHWRLRLCGWRIAVVGDATVIHLNASQDLTGWKLVEHRKGILNYYIRYRPRWQSILIRSCIIGFHSIRGTITTFAAPKQSRPEWQTVRMALSWRPAR